jgi:hypothetical protein
MNANACSSPRVGDSASHGAFGAGFMPRAGRPRTDSSSLALGRGTGKCSEVAAGRASRQRPPTTESSARRSPRIPSRIDASGSAA